MEVEVAKMEVCFLENGSFSCENGSLFLRKMEVEVIKMEFCFLKKWKLKL